MFTTAFWRAATERAIKSAAQVALLTIGSDTLQIVGFDWIEVGGFAAGGALLSVLSSVAYGIKDGNPSAVKAERVITGPVAVRNRDSADRLDA